MVTATRTVPDSYTFAATVEQSRLLGDYRARTLAAIAGTGGGKTSLIYWWLYLRMNAFKGYGWGLAEPTYPMLDKIILNSPDPLRPSILDWCKMMQIYVDYKSQSRILYTTLGQIYLGSADHPDTLQGAALKGYALDEGGMMSLTAYQTALQRVSFYDGQVFIATTPYNRGWLKTEIADKAEGNYIHVEKWRSIDNPAFPKHVYYELRDGVNALQRHRFNMMYNAEFERPEGMIYHNFDDVKCVVEPFKIPKRWPRFVGMDFGGVNTAALWYARKPNTQDYYLYREYLTGGKSTRGHAIDLKGLSKGETISRCVGGAGSEEQWRRDFREGDWWVQKPKESDVEIGIDKVFGFHSDDRIKVFNTCRQYLAEKADYRRKLDNNQQPTEIIENKERYHLMDAERYIMSDMASRRIIFELA